MKTTHNICEKLLMGYAAGVLPEAFNLVVASHLCLSDESRAMLCSYESLGGCVMNKCTGTKMNSGALEATLQKIKLCCNDSTESDLPRKAKPCIGLLPKPLQDYVGGDPDAIRWTRLGRGIKQAVLPTTKGATARLLCVSAGQALPAHGHRGMELTLVLGGAFHDHSDRFARGDIQIADQQVQHQPVADQDQDCICLMATDARLKFKTLLPRLTQPFVGI